MLCHINFQTSLAPYITIVLTSHLDRVLTLSTITWFVLAPYFSICHISECLHAINPQSFHVYAISPCVYWIFFICSQVSYSVIGPGLAMIKWGSVHVYSLSGVLVTLYIYIYQSVYIHITIRWSQWPSVANMVVCRFPYHPSPWSLWPSVASAPSSWIPVVHTLLLLLPCPYAWGSIIDFYVH